MNLNHISLLRLSKVNLEQFMTFKGACWVTGYKIRAVRYFCKNPFILYCKHIHKNFLYFFLIRYMSKILQYK